MQLYSGRPGVPHPLLHGRPTGGVVFLPRRSMSREGQSVHDPGADTGIHLPDNNPSNEAYSFDAFAVLTSRAARTPEWSAPCIQPGQGEVCSPAKWIRPLGRVR